MQSFKNFYAIRESNDGEINPASTQTKDWRKEFHNLEKGFIPPPAMRPIIEAFAESNKVVIMKDMGKDITMPKKGLYLVGGPVRDFLLGKAIKDYDLATDATPEQIATILSMKGFRYAGDRTGKKGAPLQLPFTPKLAEKGSKRIWFVKGRDGAGKAFVVSAVVNGEEFEIATFRHDAKMGKSEEITGSMRDQRTPKTNFVDSPHGDAARRDFTINSLYIELSKADGENNKLYDPTGKGLHDVKNGVVRTVGNAKDRFDEDPLRVLRGVRFHSRFSKSEKLDGDFEGALPDYMDVDKRVALERIRDEFLKGLMHPDTNVRTYVNIYVKKGLMDKVFPGLQIHPEIPPQFTEKRDKPLALAWLLQGNPLDKVEAALSGIRRFDDGNEKPTGWSSEEKRSVLYLLKLLEFDPEHVHDFMNNRRGTGLSEKQIRDWADMFNFTDAANRVRNRRGPQWVAMIKTFAGHNPTVKWTDIAHQYPGVQGPQIGDIVKRHEADNFRGKMPKELGDQ